MDICGTAGTVALIVVAAVSLLYTTMLLRRWKDLEQWADNAADNAELYYRLLSQVGDMMLEKKDIRDSKGHVLRMHSRVSFVSGSVRREGEIMFNINEKGEISRTVPICIRTRNKENFMPELVSGIRKTKERC